MTKTVTRDPDARLLAECRLSPSRRAALYRARDLATVFRDFADHLGDLDLTDDAVEYETRWVTRGYQYIFGHSVEFVARMSVIDAVAMAASLVRCGDCDLETAAKRAAVHVPEHWPENGRRLNARFFVEAISDQAARGHPSWKALAKLLKVKSPEVLRKEWSRWRHEQGAPGTRKPPP